MSGRYHYADPVQPDLLRAHRLAVALRDSVYEHAVNDRAAIAALFRRVGAALIAEGGACEGDRFNVYCNLLADYLIGLRGELHEEFARLDLVNALIQVVGACVYRMLSQHDGVPVEIIERDLKTFGWA